MFVYAADGPYVEMQEVKVLPIIIGERYSVMIRLDHPRADYNLRFASFSLSKEQQVMEDQAIVRYQTDVGNNNSSTTMYDDTQCIWMLMNGSAKADASVLNNSMLAPYTPYPPPNGAANVTKTFNINQTDPVVWVIDKVPYAEATIPVIYGRISDGWNVGTTLHIPSNAIVDIIMQVSDQSMGSMGHPMHLHGHKFWVLGTGNGQYPYASVQDSPPSILNLRNPPYRDTVLLPSSGWAVIRYVTDVPGAWIFHCHIQWHLISGMALVLVEGDEQLSKLVTTGPNSMATSLGTSPTST